MNTYNSGPTVCDRLLRRAEAARYVADRYFPCSPKTLAKLACVSSNGPPVSQSRSYTLVPALRLGCLGSEQNRSVGALHVRSNPAY